MGSWYLPGEVCKRAAIFSSAAQIATLFSGVMQARIYTSMNGLHGLEGFRCVSLSLSRTAGEWLRRAVSRASP